MTNHELVLVVGSKNYSSWSLRPHLVLAKSGLPFREEVVLLGQPDSEEKIRRWSPTARVPVLHHGELVIPDSLAIAEYVAELAPQLWPAKREDRARARALTAEMHSGFTAIRNEMSMNLRKRTTITPSPEAKQELTRLGHMWTEALSRSGGPFLFGSFSIADAFFAPVATRLRSYGVQVPEGQAYAETLLAMPELIAWAKAGENDPVHARYGP